MFYSLWSQVEPLLPGDMPPERTIYIGGTKEQIEAAKQLVNEAISEVLMFWTNILLFMAFTAHINLQVVLLVSQETLQ